MATKDELLIKTIQEPQGVRSLTLGQWDDLLLLARSANLLSKLAEAIADNGLLNDIPQQPKQHIRSAIILSQHQKQAIRWELNHIAEALTAADTPVILLKGAAYVHADLPPADGRLFGDVDVLVQRANIARVEADLMLHGWMTDETDKYNQRYYREWMHEIPPMVNQRRGTVIDVHHTILPLTAHAELPINLMIENARYVGEHSIFKVLAPVDMVIHSAAHLFYESELKNGLRDLFDLDSLLRYFSMHEPAFWEKLAQRAEQLQLSRPLSHAFRYCRKKLATPIPEPAIRQVTSSAPANVFTTAILDACYSRALQPDLALVSGAGTTAARFLLYLRGHMLRMPFPLLARHLTRKAFMRLVTASDPLKD